MTIRTSTCDHDLAVTARPLPGLVVRACDGCGAVLWTDDHGTTIDPDVAVARVFGRFVCIGELPTTATPWPAAPQEARSIRRSHRPPALRSASFQPTPSRPTPSRPVACKEPTPAHTSAGQASGGQASRGQASGGQARRWRTPGRPVDRPAFVYRAPTRRARHRLAAFPKHRWLPIAPELWMSHDGDHLLLRPDRPIHAANLRAAARRRTTGPSAPAPRRPDGPRGRRRHLSVVPPGTGPAGTGGPVGAPVDELPAPA